MMEYLRYEASITGKSILEIYREDLAAEDELRRMTPPLAETLEAARAGGAPPYLATSKSPEYPF